MPLKENSRFEGFLPKNYHLSKRDEIEILLAEYHATREEIFRRYDALVTLQSQGAIVFAAIVGFAFTQKSFLDGTILTILLIPLLWYGLVMIDFDTRSAADHLIAIERRINALAGQALLTWEIRNGLRTVPLAMRLKIRLADTGRTVVAVIRWAVVAVIRWIVGA